MYGAKPDRVLSIKVDYLYPPFSKPLPVGHFDIKAVAEFMDVLRVMLHQGHVIARDGHIQHTVRNVRRCLDLFHLNFFLLLLLLQEHIKP